MRRRGFLAAAAGLPALAHAAENSFAALEKRHGGWLGVAIIGGGLRAPLLWRGGERFAFCSTYKALAAAGVLARVDAGRDRLDRRVTYAKDQLVTYSPVTGPRQAEGMTLGEICAAAVELSDNTAGNLLLDALGGSAGFTSFLRSRGDAVTQSDRMETALNEAVPGDPRDTTTSLAMATVLQRLAVGDGLSLAGREQLAAWMVACRTGDARLRAGLPKDWRVGDRTGAGDRNTANDIAVAWPPGRPPMVIAAFYTGSSASPAQRDAVLAEVGKIAAQA